KWVKRNPVPAGAAAAVALALAAGTAVSYLKYRDAEEQKGVAQQEAVKAEQQKTLAVQEADRAKKASNFLKSIFRISETDAPGGNVTARQILADAEKRIPVEFADDPELRAELVKAMGEVRRGIAKRSPQAMILESHGPVQLRSSAGEPKEAVPQTLLN